MTTLITPSFRFSSEKQYQQLRSIWRELSSTNSITSQHIAIYTLLRNKPLLRAFTPISNKIKLTNGAQPWQGCYSALSGLDRGRLPAPFDFLDEEEKAQLANIARQLWQQPWPDAR